MTEPSEPTEPDEPAEPETSSDERAVGWGDEAEDPAYDEGGVADDERLIADRPPHYDRAD
jgi:hypothetical protein